MPKALVIGPNGFLGDFWCNKLVDLKFEVHGVGVEAEAENISKANYTQSDLASNLWSTNIKKILSQLRPEVIIFNAGIDSPPGLGNPSLSNFSMESWEKIFRVNLFSAVVLLNAIVDIEDLKPKIVLIGSQYASVAPNKNLYSHQNEGKGSVKHPAYSASKSALKAVMKQYGTELADRGARINMLSPGGLRGTQDEEFLRKFASQNPLKRMGDRNELGSALEFLIDPTNTFYIAQDLVIDGGYTSW
jgi:NAD(P)-dependent dehydrogenase (short-subunit alcohol dehydrogenase family)